MMRINRNGLQVLGSSSQSPFPALRCPLPVKHVQQIKKGPWCLVPKESLPGKLDCISNDTIKFMSVFLDGGNGIVIM